MDIGRQLRAARSMAGLSQARIAELAGIGVVTYTNIESGRSMPRLDTWWKILEVLREHGVELSDDGSISPAPQK